MALVVLFITRISPHSRSLPLQCFLPRDLCPLKATIRIGLKPWTNESLARKSLVTDDLLQTAVGYVGLKYAEGSTKAVPVLNSSTLPTHLPLSTERSDSRGKFYLIGQM